MKILILGAAGVLGRATLPHLQGHQLAGTTRSAAKLAVVKDFGARGEVADVYQPNAIARVALAFEPEIVVNFLTDLAGGTGPANGRIRREGGPIVTAAAVACGARRLVIESIAFDAGPASYAAVTALEENALGSGLEVVILRFGRLWGPGTWADLPPAPPTIHVAEAGQRAAELIVSGSPGVYLVAAE